VPTTTATAPVRVCDTGGWTDTWFAGRGVVCSIASGPGAHVEVVDEDGPPTTATIELATGERYEVRYDGARPGRHPLLEHTLQRHPPHDASGHRRVRVGADVPPGCGTGTSAAVVVALLLALRAADGVPVGPSALARDAHAVETSLGLQSGVQDQYAAAFGGCNLLHVGAYPDVVIEPIALDAGLTAALDARLVTVYLGRPHMSSVVHEVVIDALEHATDRERDALLGPLRDAASAAATALRAGDLDAYGASLVANTDGQRALHPHLVGTDADAVIALAREHRARGWKVNGAGGEGGTITVLGPAGAAAHEQLVAAIDAVATWRRLPLRVSVDGARATTT
jgi:D-glycero-alpha-D-manno-heptose-7-phosphate kinase